MQLKLWSTLSSSAVRIKTKLKIYNKLLRLWGSLFSSEEDIFSQRKQIQWFWRPILHCFPKSKWSWANLISWRIFFYYTSTIIFLRWYQHTSASNASWYAILSSPSWRASSKRCSGSVDTASACCLKP